MMSWLPVKFYRPGTQQTADDELKETFFIAIEKWKRKDTQL